MTNKNKNKLFETIERIAKFLSIVAVPIIVAYIGYIGTGIQDDTSEFVANIQKSADIFRTKNQTTVKNREIDREYVKIAFDILKYEQSDRPMKRWAISIINKLSPSGIKIEDTLEDNLLNDASRFPPNNQTNVEQLQGFKFKILLLGEFYLSSKALYDSKIALFDKSDENRLHGFLEWTIKHHKRYKEVILLGNIFDTWTCPSDQKPPSYKEIFNDNESIMKELKNLAQIEGIRFFFVGGNHDYNLSDNEIEMAVPGIRYIGSRYQRGSLLAINGNKYNFLFAEKDLNRHSVPLGYYTTRILAGKQKGKNLSRQILDETFQVIGGDNLALHYLEGCVDAAGLNDDSIVIMPEGNKIKIKEIKESFSSGNLMKSVGFWAYTQTIMGSLGRLGGVADKLCIDGINIVIMGNTRKGLIDKDWIPEKRIYANIGSWIDGNHNIVEIEFYENGVLVTLGEVNKDGQGFKVLKRNKLMDFK